MRTLSIQLVFGSWICFAVSAHGATVWDESTDGDLSNDRLMPSSIVLSAGISSVLGSMTFSDREYFTLVIPDNHELRAITPTGYAGDDAVAFIGMQQGMQFTVPPNTPTAEGLLGWFHLGEFSLNQNVLPNIGNSGFGAAGFTPPLPSGSYSFWFQQIDGLLVTYQLDFEIAELVAQPTGDYNGNGAVDAADYVLWRDTFDQMVAPGSGADGNADGTINIADLDLWRSRFGNPASALPVARQVQVVPEPATLFWGVAGLLIVVLMRYAP